MMPDGLRDREGPVVVGRELGRGGEGAVFAVPARPGIAVKLYFAPDRAREDKVTTFVRGGFTATCPSATVPRSVVRTPDGAFAGFTMRMVEGSRPLHDLYGAASRRVHFPAAGWRTVVRAAANVARAVAEVHGAGLVVGDVNHSSMLVSERSLVTVIDADSWQLGPGHPCRVGVPEYTPPELQGRPLDGVARTAGHDAFGVAVLIAQLLFLGRHPFAGVPSGRPLALPDAIAGHQFAYSLVRPVRLRPPPGALLLSDLPPAIRVGFERAFGSMLGPRYSASEWASALARLERDLLECPRDPRHWMPADAASCPWCRIERTTGRAVFGPAGAPSARARTDEVDPQVSAVRDWLGELEGSGLRAVEPPPPPPPLAARRSQDAKAFASQDGGRTHAALLRAVDDLEGGVSGDRFTRRHTAAEIALALEIVAWRRRIGVERLMAGMAGLRGDLARLATMATEGCSPTPTPPVDDAVEVALRAARVADARVPGLAVARRQMLAAAGVLTAADVGRARLAAIAGLGAPCVAALLVWRDEVAASAATAGSADRSRLARERDQRVAAGRLREATCKVVEGARRLRDAAERLQGAAARPDPAVDEARRELAVAAADLRFLRLPLPGAGAAPSGIAAQRLTKLAAKPKKGRRKAAAAGSSKVPACPRCGGAMARRWGGVGTRGAFLGCSRYPVCDGRRTLSGRRP